MSDDDIHVSNGTCYSSKGEKLDGSFIPCGNNAFGYQTCCGAGDNCLADNSCYGVYKTGYGSQLTYMAGCTDPEYEDDSCPDKKGIALTLCDDDDGVWAACSQKGDPTTLQPGSYCSCTDSSKATVAFKDADTLDAIASLPKGTGETIEFLNGYEPTSGSPPDETDAPSSTDPVTTSEGTSETSDESKSSVVISTTSFATDSAGVTTATKTVSATIAQDGPEGGSDNDSRTEAEESSGLSASAKIGIGVGAGAVVVIALIALFIILRKRKRRTKRPAVEGEAGSINDSTAGTEVSKRPSSDHHPGAIPPGPILSEVDGKPVNELQGKAADPTLTKSEVEGNPISEVGGKVADPSMVRSELEAREVRHNAAADLKKRRLRKLSTVAELPGSEPFQTPAH